MSLNQLPAGSTKKIITVIGGGPSGMTAAISAARNGAQQVRLLEKNAVAGRKLLATGNGRCNLTNTGCSDADRTLEFFATLGLMTRTEEEGRVYPYSEQASAVQEALTEEMQARNIEVLYGIEVTGMEKTKTGFRINSSAGSFDADTVILATGGKAGPQFGSTGDGYRFAKLLGHHVERLMPSLVQMVSDQAYFKELKGVRAKGAAVLVRGGEIVDRELGEIQFTEDGLSGICILNLSKLYVREDRIRIDLFPEMTADLLSAFIEQQVKSLKGRTAVQMLGGILHKKLAPVLLRQLSLKPDQEAGAIRKEEILSMTAFLKEWEVPITGTKGWKEAQVTAGGVDLTEVNLETMESKLVPGLYFAGELLDVDEKCGGYNLQWAWMSGLRAGMAAAESIKGRTC